ncbi:D-aminoacyl-tRNA deacylase [Halobacteriovorax sp. GB3]|uniref:D-aminoacyl-tRNA deacylase n=1 Tax=Halobacteriovorax sp. GB3 TaxID=2719615 RepID=UPI00235EBACD|nr:D-aminoacyl-tRNA deacylase [Halobacteriovorax sp. GB3]MDD0853588.1 D-aminoacyl-tRNA deacylase [Halobacteriovorax sp. GB3]
MKIVVQRSGESRVLVDEQCVGEISKGMVLLICCEVGDDLNTAKKASEKLLKLRIFEDEQGRMNRDIIQSEGQILAISQFTLSWDGKKGNRPSFDGSMEPAKANELFLKICEFLSEKVRVETGKFGASMRVEITNQGPVTFSLSF